MVRWLNMKKGDFTRILMGNIVAYSEVLFHSLCGGTDNEESTKNISSCFITIAFKLCFRYAIGEVQQAKEDWN
jgi:hypothetical protein